MKVNALFFMLMWPWCRFDKMCTRPHYAELVYLHPVGPADHVVLSRMSRARNIDTLFFMLGWDPYGFQKNHTGTHFAEFVFLQPVGSVGHVVHSGASRV
jgi:hypothetical protein